MTPKLLVAFFLTATLPVLAASLFSLNYFYQASFENARRTLSREIQTAKHFYTEWTKSLEANTRLAARETVVAINLSLDLTEPVLAYLERLKADRGLTFVYLIDAQGALVGVPSDGTVPTTAEQRAAALSQGGLTTLKRHGNRLLVETLVPIGEDRTAGRYFLLAAADPSSPAAGALLDVIQQTVSGPVTIGGSWGLVGSAPGSPSWDPQTRWPAAVKPGTLVSAQAGGTTYLFDFASLDGPGDGAWIGVSFSLEAFQQVTNAAAAGLVLISLFFAALSIVTAVAFSRGLTRLDSTLYSLRKTQNSLKNIFNSLTSILVSVDENGVIQEWNLAAERFSGVKAAEAIGRPLVDLSPVFQGLEPSLNLAFVTREPQFLDRCLGHGRTQQTFDLCLYPLVGNGASGVVVRMDDITESLRQDKRLRQAPKAMVDESTQKAAEADRRFMSLGRAEGSELTVVDLGTLMKEVAKTSRMVLDNSVEVEVQLSVAGPALVMADRSQLEQSLLNLINNASHAMTIMRPRSGPQGGTVVLKLVALAAVNEFHASHPGALQSDYWLIQVQDTGVGIAPENLTKIFDPFFTTKDHVRGSGPGLAMVYTSLRQHNGFIDVCSKVGRGTTFSLYLPAHAGAAVDQPVHRPAAAIQKGSGLILVVDDEPVVQTTAQMMLRACGYDVVTADNGLEALAVYQKQGAQIRAVILDSSMPKLSGPETLTALRKLNPEVKVILSSGLFDGGRIEEIPEGPTVRLLAKPYSVAELSKTLFDLLAGTPR